MFQLIATDIAPVDNLSFFYGNFFRLSYRRLWHAIFSSVTGCQQIVARTGGKAIFVGLFPFHIRI